MNQLAPWQRKLDALSRFHLREGLPAAGVDITLRLAQPDVLAAREVVRAGLTLHAQSGEILVGHIDSLVDLEQVAALPCVREVQVSQPLYQEHPR